MTKEKILDNHYKPRMHWKAVNRQNVLNAMEAYHTQKLKEMGDLQGCEASAITFIRRPKVVDNAVCVEDFKYAENLKMDLKPITKVKS